LRDHALRSAAEYANAVHLIRPAHPEWQGAGRAVSAPAGDAIDGVGEDVARFRAALDASGAWARRRAEQARAALWAEIGDSLLDRFRAMPAINARLAKIEREGAAGKRTPAAAARVLLAAFLGSADTK